VKGQWFSFGLNPDVYCFSRVLFWFLQRFVHGLGARFIDFVAVGVFISWRIVSCEFMGVFPLSAFWILIVCLQNLTFLMLFTTRFSFA